MTDIGQTYAVDDQTVPVARSATNQKEPTMAKRKGKKTAPQADKTEPESSLPTAVGKRKRRGDETKETPVAESSQQVEDKPSSPPHDDNDGDDDDDELLLAAAKWARRGEDGDEDDDGDDEETEVNTPSRSKGKTSTQDPSHDTTAEQLEEHSFTQRSLHLTQLSFDTTEFDIRQLFSDQHGCHVTSVRLVYDGIGRQAAFRGVAFVDVADTTSYQKALKLHRFFFKGRKINVRPTVTKEELENIVQRTQMQEQQRRKESNQQAASDGKPTTAAKSSPKPNGTKPAKSPKPKSPSKVPSAKKKTAAKPAKSHDTTKSSSTAKSDSAKPKTERKLTKKERNRRAAIINLRKRS